MRFSRTFSYAFFQQSLLRGVRVGGGVRRRLVQRRAVRPRTRLQPAQQALVNESLLYLLMEGFVSRLASVDHFNSALLRLLELLMTVGWPHVVDMLQRGGLLPQVLCASGPSAVMLYLYLILLLLVEPTRPAHSLAAAR